MFEYYTDLDGAIKQLAAYHNGNFLYVYKFSWSHITPVTNNMDRVGIYANGNGIYNLKEYSGIFYSIAVFFTEEDKRKSIRESILREASHTAGRDYILDAAIQHNVELPSNFEAVQTRLLAEQRDRTARSRSMADLNRRNGVFG